MMIDHIEGRVSMQIPDFSIITINHQSLNGFVSLDIMIISIYDLVNTHRQLKVITLLGG